MRDNSQHVEQVFRARVQIRSLAANDNSHSKLTIGELDDKLTEHKMDILHAVQTDWNWYLRRDILLVGRIHNKWLRIIQFGSCCAFVFATKVSDNFVGLHINFLIMNINDGIMEIAFRFLLIQYARYGDIVCFLVVLVKRWKQHKIWRNN